MTDIENAPTQSADSAPAGSPVTLGDTSESWVTPEVRKAMDFDPFTPPEDESDPSPIDATPTEGSPSADGGGTASQPASVTQAAGQPSGSPTQVPDELAQLREQNQRLLNAVLAQQQSQGQGQTQAQKPEGQKPQDSLAVIPEYNYNIPDAIVSAMASEDPTERKGALAALIKGVAQGIHQTISQAFVQRLTELESGIPNVIGNYAKVAEQQKAVADDFYTKFPQLRGTPELRRFVMSVAESHMRETNQLQWSAKVRDEIGAKVIGMLQGAVPQPAAGKAAPAAAPAMFGGSANGNPRAAKTGPKTQADFMADVFKNR